ncbi:MAG: UvrD-helicase domain-containing protein [Acidimicrobiales bacterium]
MTAAEEAEMLLGAAPCNVVLPAGAGKTELLAHAVGMLSTAQKRTLFLTHTNAGLDAFRRRLRRLSLPSSGVHISTISAFCESWCRNYPMLAGVEPGGPEPSFAEFHAGATAVLGAPSIQAVLAATWDTVLVDEYQDCQPDQHTALMQLANAVPMIVVGDPLQAVFNFPGDPTVAWQAVDEQLARLELIPLPRRWEDTNPALGDQLLALRERMLANLPIDLLSYPHIDWIEAQPHNRGPNCKRIADLDGTSVVITKHRAQCVYLAKRADGKLEALEDLASTDLFECIARIDAATPAQRVAEVGALANRCLARLPTGFQARLQAVVQGATPTFQPGATLGPFTAAALAARTAGTPESLRAVSQAISAFPDVVVARRELWTDLDLILALAAESADETLAHAANRIRELRRHGRQRPTDRVIGTPLLVKGLEYQHALVVDAEHLTREELYVSLTRGMRTVSVLSESPVFGPWT